MSRASFVFTALSLLLLACVGDGPERTAEELPVSESAGHSVLTRLAAPDGRTTARGACLPLAETPPAPNGRLTSLRLWRRASPSPSLRTCASLPSRRSRRPATTAVILSGAKNLACRLEPFAPLRVINPTR